MGGHQARITRMPGAGVARASRVLVGCGAAISSEARCPCDLRDCARISRAARCPQGGIVSGSDPIAERVQSRALRAKVCSAEQAAALIAPGSTVGMSGFTGAGYPKAVPAALAQRITEARDRGDGFAVSVWTGASTAPELDGLLAAADGIELRMPYQSDPVSRAKINAGAMGWTCICPTSRRWCGRGSSAISTPRWSRSLRSPRMAA